MADKKPPKGLFSRSIKLVGMAASVATKELGQKITGGAAKAYQDLSPSQLKTRIEQARVITETLSQLKGAAMKSGQLLSIDASDFLPPEAVEILSQLQSSADPMDFSVVENQLLSELGLEKYKQLKDLSREAEAAASIGQVHSAFIGKEKVAVKIQYPGVAESVDSDLSLLRTIAKSFVTMTGRQVDLNPTFEEIKRVLSNEANYEKELENLERYRQFVGDSDEFIVPKSYPEFSSKKILTMSWEEGVHLGTWMRRAPSKEARQKLGVLVLDLFCREFIDWGFVQTDPNFANFLVTDDDKKLILIDFGAALEYDEEFRREYAQILLDLTSDDTERMFKSIVSFDLLDERESDETKEKFREMLRVSLRPFDPNLQPFDFTDTDFEKETRETAIAFSRSLKYSAPPRKVLFLHRKLGGIFNIMKKNDVRLNLMPYWDRMTAPAKKDYKFTTS